MEAIITAATVASMFFNLASSQSSSSYVYNAKIDSDKVEVMNVYNLNDNSLTNKLQCSFKYDAENRLVSKTVQVWNEMSCAWENSYEFRYTYNESGYNLSRCCWNNKTNSFDNAKEYMDYEMIGKDVMAVNTYKYNEESKTYVLVDKILTMHPEKEILYALADGFDSTTSFIETSYKVK
nr:DUF3836 domain-containing protein [Prevotella sp.]